MVMRGERPPKGDGWKRCTVGVNAKDGTGFSLSCEDCRRTVRVDAGELMRAHSLPPDMPIYTLVQRLKCGSCGSRKVCLMISPVTPHNRRS